MFGNGGADDDDFDLKKPKRKQIVSRDQVSDFIEDKGAAKDIDAKSVVSVSKIILTNQEGQELGPEADEDE